MNLFVNIKELLTLEGVLKKEGRNLIAEDLSIIYDGAILEKDGKIFKVGPKNEIENYVQKNNIIVNKVDLENNVVLPGFVDCHTHPIFQCNRFKEFEMRIAGATYFEIAQAGGGIVSAINGTRKASKKDLKDRARGYLVSMMKHGTTTIEAKSGYGLSTESEIKMLEVIKELNDELRIEIVPTFLGAHAFPPEYRNKQDYYVDIILNEMLPQVKERELARFCDVFCDKGFFSNNQTERIVKKALDLGFDITLHVDELADTGGTSLAVDLGAKSAAHLLRIRKENIDKLAKSDCVGIMLPGTPFFLSEGVFAPARKLCDKGALVAISSDFNPGSNMCYNLPLILTMAALFMKLNIYEIIPGATYIAAKALGIQDRVGSLTEGKDLNMVSYDVSCYQEIFCHYGENHQRSTYIKGSLIQ